MVPEDISNKWFEATANWFPGDTEYRRITNELVAYKSCAYCQGPATTFDHVVPRRKDGLDDHTNLVYVCSSCNNSKNAKTLAEWLDHCNKRLREAFRKDLDTTIWLLRIQNVAFLLLTEYGPQKG